MLESGTCFGRGELPIGLGVVGVSILLPSGDFIDEGLFVWDAAIEALGRKDAEFGRANSRALECNAIRTVRRAALLRRQKKLRRVKLACGC